MDEDNRDSAKQILLIDKQWVARRHAILRETLDELVTSREWGFGYSLSVEPRDFVDLLTSVEEVKNPGLILAVAIDEPLSLLSEDQRIPRQPCDTVMNLYDVLNRLGPANDVYLIVPSGRITGVDVISLLLSGVRGVVEAEALGSPKILGKLWEMTFESDKRLNRLLIGRPYDTFNRLKEMAIGRWQISIQHWRLLLALAQIPLMRFPITSNQPKQNQIAAEISKWTEMTGYAVAQATARQLPLVLDLIKDELNLEIQEQEKDPSLGGRMLTSAEMYELPYLPLYARHIGLPNRLLPIRQRNDSVLEDLLYKGIRGLEIASHTRADDFDIARITVPRNFQ